MPAKAGPKKAKSAPQKASARPKKKKAKVALKKATGGPKKLKGHPWISNDGMSYELPRGEGLNLWACGVRRISRWTYLWASFERDKLPKVWYRVTPVGREPLDEWQLMKPGDAVLAERGETKDEEGGADLGATQDLARGQYVLAVKFKIGGQEYQLNDCVFRVK